VERGLSLERFQKSCRRRQSAQIELWPNDMARTDFRGYEINAIAIIRSPDSESGLVETTRSRREGSRGTNQVFFGRTDQNYPRCGVVIVTDFLELK
jgi:hypothetical protein